MPLSGAGLARRSSPTAERGVRACDADRVVAAERVPVPAAYSRRASFDPPLLPLALSRRDAVDDAIAAVRAIVRGWMDCIGPTTAAALARTARPAPNLPSTARCSSSKRTAASCAAASPPPAATPWSGASAGCSRASTA